MKARRELYQSLYSQKANGKPDDEISASSNDYSDVYRGDSAAVRKKLDDKLISLRNIKRSFSDDVLRNEKYVFAIEADTISQMVISAGMGHDEACTLAEIYVRRADMCSDIDELNGAFEDMCHDFAVRMGEIRKDAAHSLHIRKCIAYIYQNLNADLSVKGLSEYTGLDHSYLSKLFSAEVGITIKRFVTKAKISTACDLLKNTELPYIEIAYSLGFSTQSMFIRIFKDETGLTPKKFREKNYVWK